MTDEVRRDARRRLGFSDDLAHIASFGFVDVRTKMVDVVIEAAAWLAQWGTPVSLHLAGAANPQMAEMLTKRAVDAGIVEFEITGFLDEEQFRDYLLAVDLGVQLSTSTRPPTSTACPMRRARSWSPRRSNTGWPTRPTAR